jgi:hypothetical protein
MDPTWIFKLKFMNAILKISIEKVTRPNLWFLLTFLGYEIRMGEDGLTGLHRSLTDDGWGAVKSLLGVGSKAAPQICDRQFRSIFDLGSLLTYPESMPMQRGRLREVLLTEPKRRNMIHFSKVLKSYQIIRGGPSEQVKITFEDGTDAIGDLIIAADGSKSILNSLTGLQNRYLTDVRCITARISLTRSEMVRNLPETLQSGPVMLGLGERSVCFSSLYLPVLDDPSSIYHKNSTLMWAFAVGVDCWNRAVGYDPEDHFGSGKIDQQELFETALDLADHLNAPVLKSVMTADPITSIGYGAFRSSTKPSLNWRKEARARLGGDAGSERIWFMGDSIHAMTRTVSFQICANHLAGRGMGGNQALRDAGILSLLLPQLVRTSRGNVTDEQVRLHLSSYEKEMIPRGIKWVKASEEGHDLFDTDHFGGKVKFWMIISIMRVIKYLALAASLFTTLFHGKRQGLVERVEAKRD